jgi:hypothetical protein
LSLIQGSTCRSCFFYPICGAYVTMSKHIYVLSYVPISSGIILPGIDIGVEGKIVEIL